MGYFIDSEEIRERVEIEKMLEDGKGTLVHFVIGLNVLNEDNFKVKTGLKKPSEVSIWVGPTDKVSHGPRIKPFEDKKSSYPATSIIVNPKRGDYEFINDRSETLFGEYPDEVQDIIKQFMYDNHQEIIDYCERHDTNAKESMKTYGKKFKYQKNKTGKDIEIRLKGE